MRRSTILRQILCLLIITTALPANGQNDTLSNLFLNNGQAKIVENKISTYRTQKALGYISLERKEYELNFVPIYKLFTIGIDNKKYLQSKLDSLNTFLKTNLPKKDIEKVKNEIKNLKQEYKTSPQYQILGFLSDGELIFDNLGKYKKAYKDIVISLEKEYGSNNLWLKDPVIPYYQIVNESQTDTIAILEFKDNEQKLYYCFYFKDLNPKLIEQRRNEKERVDRENKVSKLYTNNPLFSDEKDWTTEVFKDTIIYLHKHVFSLTSLESHVLNIQDHRSLYSFGNEEWQSSQPSFITKDLLDYYNNNINCREKIEYSKTLSMKLPLMKLWKDQMDQGRLYEGTIVDTLYNITYPKQLLFDTIFEGEFVKGSFNVLKFEKYKNRILNSVDIDTVLVHLSVYPIFWEGGYYVPSNYYTFSLAARGYAGLKQEITFGIGENGISINGVRYDSRLGDQKYIIADSSVKYNDSQVQNWSQLTTVNTISEEFVENWFNIKYEQAKVYYREKALQQEREKAVMKELYAKFGEKYVKAAENFDIIVGMPEDLLPYPLKLWKITRRSRTNSGYTLYCTSMLDTSKSMVVTVTNGKVSYISF